MRLGALAGMTLDRVACTLVACVLWSDGTSSIETERFGNRQDLFERYDQIVESERDPNE